jgi:hypothetical protein
MSSNRTIKSVIEVFPPQNTDELAKPRASEVNLFAEDGWVFIERPGKGIQCVRRYDAADLDDLLQPNRVRQSYPSN